jgi:hypothetical protein
MDIVWISACQKKAIRRTRAALDRYAFRMGDSTWSTPPLYTGRFAQPANPSAGDGIQEYSRIPSRVVTTRSRVHWPIRCYRLMTVPTPIQLLREGTSKF